MTILPEYAHLQGIRPLHDHIVVLPIYEKAEKIAGGLDIDVRISAGGVAIPDEVDNEPIHGIVVALGDGVTFEIPDRIAQKIAQRLIKNAYGSLDGRGAAVKKLKANIIDVAMEPIPFEVKLGDKVLWTPWASISIQLDGIQFNIMAEDAILGLVAEKVDAPSR